MAPAVRHGDDQWFDIVKWVHFAMINAEELGVSSKNIDEALKSTQPEIRRLVGTEGDYGEQLGLTKDWVVRIVKQVGNYGESFERNVGAGLEARHQPRSQPAVDQGRHPIRAADSLRRARFRVAMSGHDGSERGWPC